MQTKIIKLDPKKPDLSQIIEIAKGIKKGEIVAFPTETVYGLGANALDEKAVKKIFEAKNRPADNPLIVHISSFKELEKLAEIIPNTAKKLAKAFWPGPLTIVLKKKKIVPDIVTCGLDTVAIRMPDSKIALALIKKSSCPISAPSANVSGKPSPTEAIHVFEDLNGKIQTIIDGGKTNFGIESTVIDLSQEIPEILRPGTISKKQIEKIIGRVNFEKDNKNQAKSTKSPGMKYTHYSPKSKVIFFDTNEFKTKITKFIKENPSSIVLKIDKSNIYNVNSLYLGKTPKSFAKNLFSSYRKIDKKKIEFILIEQIPDQDAWQGVRNRIIKSASKLIK